MATRNFKLTDRGKRNFKKVLAVLGEELTINVGILKKDGSKIHPENEDLNIAEVAAIQELGLVAQIPKRSFLRGWFEANQSKIGREIVRAGRLSFSRRRSQRKAAEVLGKSFVKQITARIDAKQIPPGNAPRTISHKGFDHPLIGNHDALRDSIDYEVKRGR